MQATIENAHIEHRPTSSGPFQTGVQGVQGVPGVQGVEPSTSFANNITMTPNSFSVSEGYSYQSYG